MAAKNKNKQVEKPKTCPKCKGELYSSSVVVRHPRKKAYYKCSCGEYTPTSSLR